MGTKSADGESVIKMESVRTFLGMPGDGAVERLSVVCAHCNAKLTPKEMDYDCKMDRLAVGLRPVFKPLSRDDETNDFLMRSSRWGSSHNGWCILRRYRPPRKNHLFFF